MVKLLGAASNVATAGGLIAGVIVLAVFLFTCWGSLVSAVLAFLPEGFLASLPPSSNFLFETIRLVSFVETVKYMSLANYVCFAVFLILVLLLSAVEEAMITVKEAIEEKAKLPSTELVRQMNGKYDHALAVSGNAYKVKQVRGGRQHERKM
ncbi:hypothetical protein TcYC6_0070730 [Trypanosoma cruzi]|nr:hypothetical protein TcYC6_0070730 [Trypanosoma cruzi]